MPSFLLQTKANVLTALMQTVECHSRRLQGCRKWHGSFFPWQLPIWGYYEFSDLEKKERLVSTVGCLFFIDGNLLFLLFLKQLKWRVFGLIFDCVCVHVDVSLLHWMIIISLPKWKRRRAMLLTLVAGTLDENNLKVPPWMEMIFTCKQYFSDWSTL